jgi:hypothetical protein
MEFPETLGVDIRVDTFEGAEMAAAMGIDTALGSLGDLEEEGESARPKVYASSTSLWDAAAEDDTDSGYSGATSPSASSTISYDELEATTLDQPATPPLVIPPPTIANLEAKIIRLETEAKIREEMHATQMGRVLDMAGEKAHSQYRDHELGCADVLRNISVDIKAPGLAEYFAVPGYVGDIGRIVGTPARVRDAPPFLVLGAKGLYDLVGKIQKVDKNVDAELKGTEVHMLPHVAVKILTRMAVNHYHTAARQPATPPTTPPRKSHRKGASNPFAPPTNPKRRRIIPPTVNDE